MVSYTVHKTVETEQNYQHLNLIKYSIDSLIIYFEKHSHLKV